MDDLVALLLGMSAASICTWLRLVGYERRRRARAFQAAGRWLERHAPDAAVKEGGRG